MTPMRLDRLPLGLESSTTTEPLRSLWQLVSRGTSWWNLPHVHLQSVTRQQAPSRQNVTKIEELCNNSIVVVTFLICLPSICCAAPQLRVWAESSHDTTAFYEHLKHLQPSQKIALLRVPVKQTAYRFFSDFFSSS